MYDITLFSIFRDSQGYLERYLNQVLGVFELIGGKCRAVWLEGDSIDNTKHILIKAKRQLKEWGYDVTLVHYNHGGPHWASEPNKDRWHVLANCWNKCLNLIKPTKYTMVVESDLIYNSEIVFDLIRKLDEDHHVIYPLLLVDRSLEKFPFEYYYDTWGFTREGKHFIHEPPYWPTSKNLIEENELLEITTGGGMILSTYDIQIKGLFDQTCCVMKYPSDIKLFAHKECKIYHPVPNHWGLRNE